MVVRGLVLGDSTPPVSTEFSIGSQLRGCARAQLQISISIHCSSPACQLCCDVLHAPEIVRAALLMRKSS